MVAVLTSTDVPYNAYGLIESDQPALCGEKVRFAGDKVALVAAETKDAAREAAWKQLHDRGYLPLVASERPSNDEPSEDEELWAAVMRRA